MSSFSDARTPRQLADAYVHRLAELEPQVATALGLHPGDDRMPDYSPTRYRARTQLGHQVLARLDELQAQDDDGFDAIEARCAALLRDRIGVELEVTETGEQLLVLRNIASPIHAARSLFLMMPTAADSDWEVIAARMAKFGDCYASLTETLEEGRRRTILSAPRQVETIIDQLGEWISGESSSGGTSWFHDFVGQGPASLQQRLGRAADVAVSAVVDMRRYLHETYLPAAQGVPDAVGRDRYLLNTRRWTGASIDPEEVYA